VNRPVEAEAVRPGETEAERDDRNLIELLQELRVAGGGACHVVRGVPVRRVVVRAAAGPSAHPVPFVAVN
jgi:hypothetical protein